MCQHLGARHKVWAHSGEQKSLGCKWWFGTEAGLHRLKTEQTVSNYDGRTLQLEVIFGFCPGTSNHTVVLSRGIFVVVTLVVSWRQREFLFFVWREYVRIGQEASSAKAKNSIINMNSMKGTEILKMNSSRFSDLQSGAVAFKVWGTPPLGGGPEHTWGGVRQVFCFSSRGEAHGVTHLDNDFLWNKQTYTERHLYLKTQRSSLSCTHTECILVGGRIQQGSVWPICPGCSLCLDLVSGSTQRSPRMSTAQL